MPAGGIKSRLTLTRTGVQQLTAEMLMPLLLKLEGKASRGDAAVVKWAWQGEFVVDG